MVGNDRERRRREVVKKGDRLSRSSVKTLEKEREGQRDGERE